MVLLSKERKKKEKRKKRKKRKCNDWMLSCLQENLVRQRELPHAISSA